MRYALAIYYTNVFADRFLHSNKNTTFLSKNYWSLSLKISFYKAVHSYACGNVAQLLGQTFLAEVGGAKHDLSIYCLKRIKFLATCLFFGLYYNLKNIFNSLVYYCTKPNYTCKYNS